MRYTLIAGNPKASPDIVDGIGPAARFSQPRGMCQLVGSGNLLMVDGAGSTAVVRHVDVMTREQGGALA